MYLILTFIFSFSIAPVLAQAKTKPKPETKKVKSSKVVQDLGVTFNDVRYDDGSRKITIDYGTDKKKDVLTFDPTTNIVYCNGEKIAEQSTDTKLVFDKNVDSPTGLGLYSSPTWRYLKSITHTLSPAGKTVAVVLGTIVIFTDWTEDLARIYSLDKYTLKVYSTIYKFGTLVFTTTAPDYSETINRYYDAYDENSFMDYVHNYMNGNEFASSIVTFSW